MTTAVPILFSPVIYKNKVYIDGGLIDNFPINLFEDNLTNVIGINLKSEYFKNTEINNIIDYFVSILQILSNRITNKYDFEKYKNILYTIDMSISNPFNFTLTKEIKKELFYKGYNFMKDNFIHYPN
jgi:NTE family protein